MKSIIKTLVVFSSLIFTFSSCEKVIDLNLNEAEKKYVIEAVVTDQAGLSKVVITQTKKFDENNTFPGVSGASVIITESGGASYPFTETTPGKYESLFAGVPGKKYILNVTIGSNQFNAECVMPRKVNLDSIFVTDELLFTEVRKIVNAQYRDPQGRGDAYRFVQFVNGLKEDQLLIQNDDYTDGRNVTSKLYYFADEDSNAQIESGDTVTIDMQCISPVMYKYWFSLDRSATGIGGQATPANPVTNMKGGALGYFSAHTLQSKTVIVQ